MSIERKQVFDETTGIVTREEHSKNDKLHREGDQPAVIERDPKTGNVTFEGYYKDGMRHREGDQLTVIEYDPKTGIVTSKEYFENDKRHRKGDKPACITTIKTGNKTCEEYWKDGKRHRDGDKPAYIVRNATTGIVPLRHILRTVNEFLLLQNALVMIRQKNGASGKYKIGAVGSYLFNAGHKLHNGSCRGSAKPDLT